MAIQGYPFAQSRLVKLAVLFVLPIWITSCNSSNERSGGVGARSNNHAGADLGACDVLSVNEINKALEMNVTENPSSQAPNGCVFADEKEPDQVTVSLGLVADVTQEGAWLDGPSGSVGRTAVKVAGADAAWVWNDTPNDRLGVARVGSGTMKIRVTTQKPSSDLRALELLLTEGVDRIPRSDTQLHSEPTFDQDVCDLVSLKAVRSATKNSNLKAQATPAGCAFMDSSGAVLTLDVQTGGTQEQLEAPPAVSTVDGIKKEWPVELVDGVGDGARWTLDPFGQQSGELLVLSGNELVRVSSSSTTDGGAQVRDRALALAKVFLDSGGR